MYNKKLIEKCLEFIKLEIEELTIENKHYVIELDKLFKSIQNSVLNEKQKIIFNITKALTDTFVGYVEHTNDKFYKSGFYDAIYLIL